MSYIDELKVKDFSDAIFPTDARLFEACAEVDRLRTDLAAARAEAERATAELVETRIEADTMRQHHKNAEAVIADLPAAGGRPFIRSEAIRNCRETIAQQKGQLAALAKECEALRRESAIYTKGLVQIRDVMRSIKGARLIARETLDAIYGTDDQFQAKIVDAARTHAQEGGKKL